MWIQHLRQFAQSRFAVVIFVTLAGWLILQFLNWRIGPAQVLGVKDGKLAACSDRQNCVSSQSEDPDHSISPLSFTASSRDAQEQLKQQVLLMPRTWLVRESGNYLHFEVRSLVFRFVDDLELLVEPGVIHIRSVSRLGYNDLGVNRRRVEEIRRLFEAAQKEQETKKGHRN